MAPLAPATAGVLASLIAIGLAAQFWTREGFLGNILVTAAVTLLLGALVALATRRVLFAAVVTAGLVILVNGISAAKLATVGMVLHAYDIVFYLGSWSTLAYLCQAAPFYVAVLGGGVVLLAGLATLAFRLDATRVARRTTGLVALLALAVGLFAGHYKAERRHTQFHWQGLFLSSFYASWVETAETLWRGQLVEAAAAATAPAFAVDPTCRPAVKPPHIVLIHQESLVQPALFPTLAYDRSVDPLFRSFDGRIHKLRVETYGGASWLTEFSILTGLSTHAFGGMRPFVQSLLAGKVRDTLPEVLVRCGYRNVLFYPMLRNFVSNARFYEAIGLKEIFDLKDQRAPSAHERDRFYYDNALAEMSRHVATSDKPLFTYIQTMSAHWPYTFKFAPEIDVAGGGAGTDGEMSEYLRRVAIARRDHAYLMAELKRRFPGERILVVQYGDHHPQVTRSLLGVGEATEVEDVELGPLSTGFITYYAVDAVGMRPAPLPAHDVVDVPYLGTILLQQAGLPLSEPYHERLRLMRLCQGHYHTCRFRADVLAFHRRLLDSRLIDAR